MRFITHTVTSRPPSAAYTVTLSGLLLTLLSLGLLLPQSDSHIMTTLSAPSHPVSDTLLLTELHVKIEFDTLKKAQNVIKRAITDAEESFKVDKADHFC